MLKKMTGDLLKNNIKAITTSGKYIDLDKSEYIKEYKMLSIDKAELKKYMQKEHNKHKTEYNENQVFVIFSYTIDIIETFYEVYGNKNLSIIVFPNKNYLYTALHHIDISSILNKYNEITTAETDITNYAARMAFSLRGIKTFIYNPIDLYKGGIQKTLNKIHDHFSHNKTNIDTLIMLGDKIAYNQIANIKNVLKCKPATILKYKCKNKPVVCVAAGPSLNTNIDYLKEIQDNVFIISTASAYKSLIKKGIKPDLITILDMQKQVADYLKDIEIVCPVVCDICVASNVFELDAEFIFCVASDDPSNYMCKLLTMWGVQYARIPMSFSVAFFSYHIANYMSASKIIMLGQDLSYPNSKTHVDEARFSQDIYVKDSLLYIGGVAQQCIMTTSWDGKSKVPTTRTFMSYKTQLENTALKLNLVNATEGGAYIDNCEHMTLLEAFDTYIRNKKKNKLTFNKTFKQVEYHKIREYLLSRWTEVKDSFNKLDNKDITQLNKMLDKFRVESNYSKFYCHSFFYFYCYMGIFTDKHDICHKTLLEAINRTCNFIIKTVE